MNQFGKDLSMNSLVSHSEYFKDIIVIFKGITVILKFCQNSFFSIKDTFNYYCLRKFSIMDIIVIFEFILNPIVSIKDTSVILILSEIVTKLFIFYDLGKLVFLYFGKNSKWSWYPYMKSVKTKIT